MDLEDYRQYGKQLFTHANITKSLNEFWICICLSSTHNDYSYFIK